MTMKSDLKIRIDRTAKVSLSEQIRASIGKGIESGLLPPGTRLPSWQDLAVQLGVARGTVQAAYERLTDAQMIESHRARGTRVAPRLRAAAVRPEAPPIGPFMRAYQEMHSGPAVFQLGVPAIEGFPDKLFTRARSSNLLKTDGLLSLLYPDPRGELELRKEIAGYLSIARGFHCFPEQVFITSGYASGLGLSLRVLGLERKKVWMEEPGFMVTRRGLQLAGLDPVPIPVDAEGIDVECGIRTAPDAALAVLTPGQQAPLGSTLSLRRRLQLLEWAASNKAWIIEDDYLSELQLDGRPAPALSSLDAGQRVIHIGSFSKTICPALRLGFVVAPSKLVNAFSEVVSTLGPAPSPVAQLATARFMGDGHYVRRVRRMKRLYSAQRDALCEELRKRDAEWACAGLTVLLRLPDGAPDKQIVREAMAVGMGPSPLSGWYASQTPHLSGVLLGIATAPEGRLAQSCRRLFEIIERYR